MMAAHSLSATAFYAELVKHKLILPVGVPGAFGRGAVFEDVVRAFDALVSRFIAGDQAEHMLFPPILDRAVFERSGYLDSCPHLVGSVFAFEGSEARARELSMRVAAGAPWGDLLAMTNVVLMPAACYPVYPACTGTLPAAGRLVDTQNWIFRHEPSPEPTRLQAFRMRELVRIGTPRTVIEWRNGWLARGLDLLTSLQLPVRAETASDPFFGRGGRLMAENQRQQELKFEVVIPILADVAPTAVCSFNYHLDHFGESFGIRTPDGLVAHSACLGFGMERITMALLKTHGFVPAEWPTSVRERLWG
jgi:seryl-tRNA synthetase